MYKSFENKKQTENNVVILELFLKTKNKNKNKANKSLIFNLRRNDHLNKVAVKKICLNFLKMINKNIKVQI